MEDAFRLNNIMGQFRDAMSNTIAFQVAVYKLCCQVPDSQLAPVKAFTVSRNPKALNIPVKPDTLGPDFSLCKRGNGYRFGCYHSAMTVAAERQAELATAEDDKAVNHLLYTFAVYTWCKEEANKNTYYWQPIDLLEH